MVHTIEEHIIRIIEGEKLGSYKIDLGITCKCNLNCVMCGRKLITDMYKAKDKDLLIAIMNELNIPKRHHKQIIKKHNEIFKLHQKHKIRVDNVLISNKIPRDVLIGLKSVINGLETNDDIITVTTYAMMRFEDYLLKYFTEDMTYEQMMKIIDEAHEMETQSFSLAGIGEPFLRWKELSILMKKIKGYNMIGSVTSNATLITSDIARALVDLRWDRINISIESNISSVNDALRGKGAYASCLKGIMNVINERDRKKIDVPRIDLNVVLTNKNIDSIPNLIEFAHNIGVDGVYFLPLMVHTNYQTKLNPSDIEYSNSYLRTVASMTKHLKIDSNASSIINQTIPLSSKMYFKNGKKDWQHLMKGILKKYPRIKYTHPIRQNIRDIRCLEPWTTMVIDTNGKVNPCCLTYFSFMNLNIKHMSLGDAWNSPEINYLRSEMLSNGIPEECHYVCHPLMLEQTEEIKNNLLKASGLKKLWPWK